MTESHLTEDIIGRYVGQNSVAREMMLERYMLAAGLSMCSVILAFNTRTDASIADIETNMWAGMCIGREGAT